MLLFFAFLLLISSTRKPAVPESYLAFYSGSIQDFRNSQEKLLSLIRSAKTISPESRSAIISQIRETRLSLRKIEFWLRYLEPIAFRRINGPLPVEWETEVFEKFEAPYRREGAGLTLAEIHLDEDVPEIDTLLSMIIASQEATAVFVADSVTKNLHREPHFFLANRLHLLNLAAIYTTGFDCPDTGSVIPELRVLMESTASIYDAYEKDFASRPLSDDYKKLYRQAIRFVNEQPGSISGFDHFTFIRDYVNPLYTLNAGMIIDYNVRSASFVDYSLNREARSIFDKTLYRGQNRKGVFIGVDDSALLREITAIGKTLFFDPILSGNNKRSCASCHKPGEVFADTAFATSPAYDKTRRLIRNTPSLVNAVNYHLLMADGKHYTLENQAREVIANPEEMGSSEKEVLEKIMSCPDYKAAFKKFLRATPQYESVNINHISSAMMLYYSSFSNYYALFDHAMEKKITADPAVARGFNIFMGKAKCGTCHFTPQFNGTKPPYTGSEFEVIGVPADTTFTSLGNDRGRYGVHAANEMQFAFRTPTTRNAARSHPYMHNGIFSSLDEVINFYDAGGGKGRGLDLPNQTLPSDSLKLTMHEKKDIIAFLVSLDEEIPAENKPVTLPQSKNRSLNARIPGGEY